MNFKKIKLSFTHRGRVARLVLAAPKANILDHQMISEIMTGLDECTVRKPHAIVISAEGPHFSFGASVQEHMPDHIAQTLAMLHSLIRKLMTVPAPTIAAVQGQCLGGGFELVLGCDLVIAEEGALFSCPEIKLGLFPPAASALLPVKLGTARAASMVIAGSNMFVPEALACGMVSRMVAVGRLEADLKDWLETDFLTVPALALQCASRSVRWSARVAFDELLPSIERTYLDTLMDSPDAVEGIRAFLEKREPNWDLQVH